jgi:hypothetical protein
VTSELTHVPCNCKNSFSSFDGERFTRRTDLDHNHLKGAMVSVPERGLVMIGGAEGSRRTSSSVEILQNGRSEFRKARSNIYN